MPGLGICLLCISLAAPVSPPGKSPELVERERQLDSIYNPPVSETGADMHFATRVVDAGTIKENAVPPEYTYTWTNGGDRPVTVLKVTTTCGCAVPSFDRAPVLPGEEGSLKVTYHPKGRLYRPFRLKAGGRALPEGLCGGCRCTGMGFRAQDGASMPQEDRGPDRRGKEGCGTDNVRECG